MKIVLAFLLMWAASAPALLAQVPAEVGGVSSEILIGQDEYIPGEEVKVGVRIVNRSGETLFLGKDNKWLTISVESNEKRFVRETSPPPVTGAFSIPPSKMGTKMVPLWPFFDIRQPGRYIVSAVLQIPSWGEPIKVRAKTFDVIAGTPVRSVQFGVPNLGARPNTEPETRRYVLQKLDRLGRVKLYFTLTDASGSQVYEAFPLCETPAASLPEIQLDSHNNAHVMVQTGVKTALYYEINFVGVVVGRQTFQYASAVPRLGMDKNGNVIVTGGQVARQHGSCLHPSCRNSPPLMFSSPKIKNAGAGKRWMRARPNGHRPGAVSPRVGLLVVRRSRDLRGVAAGSWRHGNCETPQRRPAEGAAHFARHQSNHDIDALGQTIVHSAFGDRKLEDLPTPPAFGHLSECAAAAGVSTNGISGRGRDQRGGGREKTRLRQPTNAVPTLTVTVALRPALPQGKKDGKWHGEIQVGTDAEFASTSHQLYSGKIKLTYAKDIFPQRR